jgi:enterochelin esterase-like enzyme
MRLHPAVTDLPRRAAGLVGRVLGPPGRALARAGRAAGRLAGRRIEIVVAVAAGAMCGVLLWLLGPGLQGWFVAQGMDSQRADLLSAMVLVILATAIVGAVSRRAGATRIGGLLGFIGIQIIPFLIQAANEPSTPGLRYTEDISGWILQPLGMLLLAVVCVIVGAALGVGLARDAARIPALLRRRWLWLAIPIAIALIVAASGAAITALQQGPFSALRDYSVGSGGPVTAVAPPTQPSGSMAPDGPVTATPDISLLRQLPGQIQYLNIGAHPVDVYVPGLYLSDSSVSLPVLYLLHGTPGQPSDWIQGAQLVGVLNQLIGDGDIPPMFVVLPNGDRADTSDTEWGNSAYAQVESWLVDEVVPTIDSDYPTLGAEYRGIAGLSSGGYGAVNIAIHQPSTFSFAASYSGYFIGLSSIFGSQWRANSPLYTAAGVPTPERFPIYLGAGTTDTLYRPDTTQFANTLAAIGWTNCEYQTVPGGHGWVAWEPEFVNSLNWLGELWGPTPWLDPPGTG